MRSNRIPFTDVCNIIKETSTEDSDGYPSIVETKREVFCSVCDGVSRSEFYEAAKAGVKLAATFEVQEVDLDFSLLAENEHEELLEYAGKRYKIERTYPTGNGTLELSCSEVVR